MVGLVRRAAALLLLLASAALAGCAADDGPAKGPAAAAEGAAIHGVVVSPAVVPLAGVAIRLAPAQLEATTGADGSFLFDNLAEGAYTLEAGKAGYRNSTVAIQAAAGSPIVQVVLEPDPRVGAYADAYVFDGFVANSFNVAGARSGGGGPNYTIGERRPDLIQVEMVWEATQSFGRWLDITALPDDGQSGVVEDIGHVKGPSPLLLKLNATAMEAGKLGPKVGLDLALFAGEEPVAAEHGGSVVLNQPYRIVTHMFYGYLPPEGWRFTSDGDPPAPP